MQKIKLYAKSTWVYIKSHKIIALILLVVLVGGGIVIKVRSDGEVETTTPVTMDLVRNVKIAGKVIPKQSASLGFETSGIVSSISKNVGDTVSRGTVLARLDSSAISNDILQAQAELKLAQAELDKLEGGGAFEAQIDNSKRTLIQTIKDSYTTADDAVHNKTDQIFIDARTSRPEIGYAFSDNFDLRDSIIKDRSTMDEKLNSWETLVNDLTLHNYSDAKLTESKKYLSEISSYINNVAQAVNLFKANSSINQSTIDTYKSDALSARNNLNSVSGELITSEDKYRGLLSDVPAQVARVESAKASLANNKTRLSKTYLISPINGIVSRNEAKVGQVVSAATDIITIISKDLEIEAFIPEILVSGVKVGNGASVTLDAYGDKETFEAKVVHIDPAETIRDGVSTYKVRLVFLKKDDRIKPGMTSNIVIETFRKPQVTLIPERAVFKEDDGSYVYVLNKSDKEIKTKVDVGERDSSGHVELISSLPEGTRIVVNPDEGD